MPKVQVFEPAMCCSTGVCGPSVDPALVRFAADCGWLTEQGVTVERFNLANSPLEFARNPEVRDLLGGLGAMCLPVTLVDGKVTFTGIYPTRAQLAEKLGLRAEPSISLRCG